MKIKISTILIILYIVIAIIVFCKLVYPSLTGQIDIRAFNDVDRYELIAKNTDISNYHALTNISNNTLGPVTILRLFNYNYTAIFVFNLSILIFSIKLLFSYYQINKKIFLTFLFLNPSTMFSLCYANKELLTLFTILLLIIYVKNRNFLLFILTVLVAYFSRWQLSLFIIITFICLTIDKFYKKRLLVFILLISSISLAFPASAFFFNKVFAYAAKGEVVGSGIFQNMTQIQHNYYGGYLIVFIPKLLQLLFGLLSRASLVTDLSAFWNNVVQFFNSVSFLILSLYLIYKKKINMQYILFYIAIIFSTIFILTPIYSIRYFYGMYIILCVLAAQPVLKEQLIPSNHNSVGM